MHDIDYLIHVTDFNIITDIFESKYLYPQSKTGVSNLAINRTDKEKIFVMIVTKNAPNMGLDWKNLSGERRSILLFNKSLLLDQEFLVNPNWYGYSGNFSFDSSKNSLRGREFRNLIKNISNNFNSRRMIMNEVLLSEPVSLEKYFLGAYTVYGNIYQDICDVNYLKIIDSLYQFLVDTEERTREYLSFQYMDFHIQVSLSRDLYPKAFSGVIELNNNCTDYEILGKRKI